jgi:hypothetical protein
VIPEADVARVERWCAERVPEDMRHRILIECEVTPRHITILERVLGGDWGDVSVARLRYTARQGLWTLYWPDRNGNFHEYQLLRPSPRVKPLLDEIERDPTFIFWG